LPHCLKRIKQLNFTAMFLIGSEKSINAVELLIKTGLDWSVSKEPLVINLNPDLTDQELEEAENLGMPQVIPTEYVAILREDTKTVLGVHKAGYEVFQNQELAELILDLSKVADAPLHSFGTLKGGAKVYIQLKTGNTHLRRPDGTMDTIEGFGTIVNSFDGSTSLGIGISTVTISCMNKYFAAYRQLDSKIKHTKGMTVRVEDLLKSMDIFRKDESEHFDLIRRLASAPITAQAIDTVYKGMFDVSFADAQANRTAKVADRTLSTKKTNLIETFTLDTANQITDKGETLWGLFSGITKYTTHSLGADSEEAKMFGSVASKERVILSKFADLVK